MYSKTTARVKPESTPHNIRITVWGDQLAHIEECCADLKQSAKEYGVRMKGPVRCPTKVLRITTRKTPCGEGSKTWDRFQMRVHKRYLSLHTTVESLKEISCIVLHNDINIEVTIADAPHLQELFH
ncbi:hypothetical protein L596_025636 [Steinernema carpocapsae]|uniref:Small ribosomal subunit protein uS10 n=1 Tax=Steinernema carpocapsae TaxID=34508 RepID=A0A4U5M8B6_STECR|nr:hypothetical protein L596_025636 [Steinernema carpocapsae]